MEADVFVRGIATAAPSAADLEKCGLSGEEASDFIKSFRCVRRNRPLPELRVTNPTVELLRIWDLSKVEVGMVRFPNPPAEQSGKVYVGCVESDPMAILPDSGEVVVEEFGTLGHLLWVVAKNGSNLLDALLIAARFLGRRAVGAIDFNDFEAAKSAAVECAFAAGGQKYLAFFKMLLGAE